jgi:LAS superfamily LD-carboxypeptidase LdcB
MRVIEPRHHVPRPTTKKKSKKRLVFGVTTLVVLIMASFGLLAVRSSNKTAQEEKPSQIATASTVQELEQVASAQDVRFKFFTGDQFQRLYESLNFPNTQAIVQAPMITGNEAVDARIQTIAESRGYKLRSVPVLPIIKTNEPGLKDDDLLQPKAFSGWKVLEDMAKKDNVPILKLNSGYRSIENQRALFVSRLRANGGDPARIAAGAADDIVVRTLHMTAPPGYSRHHTGYTVDLVCDDGTGLAFEKTKCFQWISANNYDKAKRAGWVPSYPEGAPDQGPEPEPWEYVWVGLSQVTE